LFIVSSQGIFSSVLSFFCFKVALKIRFGLLSSGGRNFLGRICIFNRGGGNKQKYTILDFFRRINQFGVVYQRFVDSQRSAFIGLILYDNGIVSCIPLSVGVLQGSRIFSGIPFINNNLSFGRSFFSAGSALPIKNINLFSILSFIESFPCSGAIFARSAGVGALLIACANGKATLKLNSG